MSEVAAMTSAGRRARLFDLFQQAGMLLVLLALFLAALAFVPHFSGGANLRSVALSVSTVALVSCTMLFCLASGNFDLSVGTVVPCGGVVAALVTNHTGSFALGLLAALGMGAAVGLLNGVVIACLRINPLITTLATMQMVKTVSLAISDQRSVGTSNAAFVALGGTRVGGINLPIWMAAVAFLLFGLLLSRTVYGRDVLAIGGNEEAARLAGVPVRRTKIAIFVIQGMVAAFAGVVVASRLTLAQPNGAEGFELQVIAACVLGGVSLSGGIGKMSFVVAGVLIMGIVENVMNLLQIPSLYQYGVRGGVLLAAVIIDSLKPKR